MARVDDLDASGAVSPRLDPVERRIARPSDRVAGGDDVASAPVVVAELQDADAVPSREVPHVLDASAAKTIDRLREITDRVDVRWGERAEDPCLELGGVLKLVDEHVLGIAPHVLDHAPVLFEQLEKRLFEPVEIARVVAGQRVRIHRAQRLAFSFPFRPGDQLLDALAVADLDVEHVRDVGSKVELVGLVEDREVLVEPDTLGVTADDGRSPGMERPEVDLGRRRLAEASGQPLAHLASRLRGERHAHDRARPLAVLDEPCDALGQDAGLARTGGCEHEGIAPVELDGGALGVIEVHAAPSLPKASSSLERNGETHALPLDGFRTGAGYSEAYNRHRSSAPAGS